MFLFTKSNRKNNLSVDGKHGEPLLLGAVCVSKHDAFAVNFSPSIVVMKRLMKNEDSVENI